MLFCLCLSAFFAWSIEPEELSANKNSEEDFATSCKNCLCLLSVENSCENPAPTQHAEPLVVVTDTYGNEFYSKIEVVNESPYLWAVAHSEKLEPGVYLITSTSTKNLFKKTLIIQAK